MPVISPSPRTPTTTPRSLRGRLGPMRGALSSCGAYHSCSLESIESRRLLSASMSSLHDGMLMLRGTRGDDAITVTVDPNDATRLAVKINADAASYARADVRLIIIRAGAGNDFISLSSMTDPNSLDPPSLAVDVPSVIHAGDGHDTVLGGNGRDIIHAGKGNDLVNALGGNDVVYGNAGDDSLTGGDGDDLLEGGEGNDVLEGDGFASMNPGNDVLRGGRGNDVLYGDAGNDWLIGGDGNDELSPGAGRDSVVGGRGLDVFYVGATGSSDDFDNVYHDRTREELVLVDSAPLGHFSDRDFKLQRNALCARIMALKLALV
jgi:Ca2+-binding RTX toxin-like protein